MKQWAKDGEFSPERKFNSVSVRFVPTIEVRLRWAGPEETDRITLPVPLDKFEEFAAVSERVAGTRPEQLLAQLIDSYVERENVARAHAAVHA